MGTRPHRRRPQGVLMEERPGAVARAVDSIGITVSDVDRAAGFFANALAFEKVTEIRSTAAQMEKLLGVPSPELRTVRCG